MLSTMVGLTTGDDGVLTHIFVLMIFGSAWLIRETIRMSLSVSSLLILGRQRSVDRGVVDDDEQNGSDS